jgi:hypothetical protein
MSAELRMGRVFLMMAVLGFVVSGVAAFFTHRAAHVRTRLSAQKTWRPNLEV